MTVKAAIGLGSNLAGPLGEPAEQLARAFEALAALPQTRLLARSRLYRSVAVGPAQPDYLNACALLETGLAPLALLDALQAIEAAHQRVRSVRWGPRTLDLDLLLYGDQTLSQPRLTVPHAQLCLRNFVLYPLAEVWPDARLPDGRSIDSLLAGCTMEGLTPLSSESAHKE